MDINKKKTKINIASYIIIILSIVVLICYVVFVDGFSELYNVIMNARLRWLFAGAGLLIIYWLLESWILHIASKKLYKKQKFIHTVKTTIIGQYFNCITPSASGGQPMQAYHMHNCGMPVGNAVGALLLRFVIYQVMLTVYCAIVLILGGHRIAGKLWLVLIGFVVNAVVVAGLLGLAFAPRLIQKVGKGLVHFLNKLHIIKDKAKFDQLIDVEVEKFCKSMKRSGSDIKSIIKMGIITIFQLTAYFLIPFCVFKALGVALNPFWAICASAFVLMVSSFVPLPGAAGGAEGSFLIYFGILLGPAESAKGATAVLLWRILTFYFPILVGAFFAKNISKKVASVEDVIKEETTEIISEIQDDGELNVSDYDS